MRIIIPQNALIVGIVKFRRLALNGHSGMGLDGVREWAAGGQAGLGCFARQTEWTLTLARELPADHLEREYGQTRHLRRVSRC